MRIAWTAPRTKRRIFWADLPLLAVLMLAAPTWLAAAGWAALGLYMLLAGEPDDRA